MLTRAPNLERTREDRRDPRPDVRDDPSRCCTATLDQRRELLEVLLGAVPDCLRLIWNQRDFCLSCGELLRPSCPGEPEE